MFSAFEGGYIFLPLSHQKSPVLNVVVYKHAAAACACPCLTLCNPIDGSPPGCPVPGILQARILKWAAISFSNAWKWKVKVRSLSRVRLFVTPWTGAYQAPLSMGFSRQEYWSGMPSPSLCQGLGSSKFPKDVKELGLGNLNFLHWGFLISSIVRVENGNPLQCSCLENPRDGGAWWAAVYGAAQSWTQLKWLSSSSSNRHQQALVLEFRISNLGNNVKFPQKSFALSLYEIVLQHYLL